MGADLTVSIRCRGWDEVVPDPAATCERAVAAAWDLLGADRPVAAEIGLALTDDAEMAALNARYRGVAAPTNVLSFASGELDDPPAAGPLLLGDIVLARETLMREAGRDDRPVADHMQHLVVHGLLHLLGYDHEAADAAAVMESLEVRILGRLGVADPYEGSVAIAARE